MKKKVSKKKATTKKKVTQELKHYWLCEDCANKRGGIFPEGHCCTVTYAACPYCGTETTIIPWVDFNWPKDKKRDIISKVCRD